MVINCYDKRNCFTIEKVVLIYICYGFLIYALAHY